MGCSELAEPTGSTLGPRRCPRSSAFTDASASWIFATSDLDARLCSANSVPTEATDSWILATSSCSCSICLRCSAFPTARSFSRVRRPSSKSPKRWLVSRWTLSKVAFAACTSVLDTWTTFWIWTSEVWICECACEEERFNASSSPAPQEMLCCRPWMSDMISWSDCVFWFTSAVISANALVSFSRRSASCDCIWCETPLECLL
mmetsp:Transcript_95507/g.270395  ORF Transcript_95507/g.270395 Transcript_95507/m.270395 type:complete len:204 (+) Transcript_95507:566-1177(+)